MALLLILWYIKVGEMANFNAILCKYVRLYIHYALGANSKVFCGLLLFICIDKFLVLMGPPRISTLPTLW